MMESLLPVHSALTLDWLVDGAATAAERGIGAPFTFVYFEDQDGRLDYRAPASDLRRRSLQRLIDALDYDVSRRKIDPGESQHLSDALDNTEVVVTDAVSFFELFVPRAKAEEAGRSLALSTVAIAPVETAGERLGAMVMLFHDAPDEAQVRLLAQHIACAAVNLRNAQNAREAGVIDAVRSVFDARKLESELQRELQRADRYKREVSVVVIEATNLALLRDQFGSFLTDQLLQRLGGALAQHARDVDVIGAYKESGYVMILTEATGEGAAGAATRLLQTAESMRLDEHVPGLELHLVAGWAACPADGVTSDALFAAAERRMYGTESSQVA
jgi:diguanylate cyclase (GGDEF)-like protein